MFLIIIPYIEGEENKIQAEACKILGTIEQDLIRIVNQSIPISVACNRVPVLDGHLVCVSTVCITASIKRGSDSCCYEGVRIRGSDSRLFLCSAARYCWS